MIGLSNNALSGSAVPLAILATSTSWQQLAAYATGRPPRVPRPPAVERAAPKKAKPAPAKPVKAPRAIGAYSFFVKEQAGKYSGFKGPDLIRQCALDWKQLQPADKAPFEALAAASKEQAAAERAELKKQRAPLQPYAAYVSRTIQELRARQPGLAVVDYMRMAAEQWKHVPDADKEQAKADYAAARAAWLASKEGSL